MTAAWHQLLLSARPASLLPARAALLALPSATARNPLESAVTLSPSSEVFDHIRDIVDPEHPYTLEQLNVVEEELVDVDDAGSHVR